MKESDPINLIKVDRTIKVLDKEHGVVDVTILNPDLIEQGDRVIISTKTGNRYMVRRSRSHGGALMISSEKESGFEKFYTIHN
jgi:hypothetical protein